MSRHGMVALSLAAWVLAGFGLESRAQEALTEEEANRPWEEWTEEQIREKGWIPYADPIAVDGRGVEGRRWPQNDPAPPRLGTCVTYSFMPAGVALEPGEGVNTWPAAMPAGSAAAVTAATATWTVAADVHFKLVADGGGAWDAAGAAGLVGDIRVGSGDIDGDGKGATLAHAYYPPPNGVSAAGDLHFDSPQTWSVATPPPAGTFDVQTVALHELGHSLGLDHAGTLPGEVMFGAYEGVKRALTAPDITDIQAIYGAAPHTKDKPTVSEWGMAALTLLLLSAITLKFGRRRAVTTPA